MGRSPIIPSRTTAMILSVYSHASASSVYKNAVFKQLNIVLVGHYTRQRINISAHHR
jgi:hypothetical protein